MTRSRPIDSIARFFDEEASRFPLVGTTKRSFLRGLIDRIFRRSIWLRFERTMQLCQPPDGRSVLDIGCGAGAYSIELALAGAKQVIGIDFAPRMIEAAWIRSGQAGVHSTCRFEIVSFAEFTSEEAFDYVIAMGVLDYIEDANAFIKKALSLARRRACFSLPNSAGLLAWQRRLRYRNRCPLFMYRETDVRSLFEATGRRYQMERLARDWYVSVECSGDSVA